MSKAEMRAEERSFRRKIQSLLDTRTLTALYQWSKPVRRQLVGVCLTGIMAALLSLTIPLITRQLVDQAAAGVWDSIIQYGLALAGVILLTRGARTISEALQLRAAARFQRETRQELLRRILGAAFSDVKAWHSGELVNRVFSDVNVVRSGIVELFPSILQTVVSFVGASVILIRMDWRFLPVLLLCSISWMVVSLCFRKPVKARHQRMQEAEDAAHSALQENLENLRTVKACDLTEHAERQGEEKLTQLARRQVENGRLSLAVRSGMGGMFDLSWLICYLWGCVKIFRGEFTYGSLAALIPLVNRIQSPVANASRIMGQVYGVFASAERLLEILDIAEEENRGQVEQFEKITLRHVSFQYEDGSEPVLRDLTGEIRRGEFIAFTGRSGIGKTSLFHLLLGLYAPTEGEIRVWDGKGESVPASRGTRGLFACVPQGNTLFSGSLRENLTLFSGDVPDSELDWAIRTACLEDLVREIGLDARLGEHGIGLSEGQAQRVAITRALLRKAPILLLDESTSALDEQTETRLLRNLAETRGTDREMTALIVTHRRAALEICDQEWRMGEA